MPAPGASNLVEHQWSRDRGSHDYDPRTWYLWFNLGPRRSTLRNRIVQTARLSLRHGTGTRARPASESVTESACSRSQWDEVGAPYDVSRVDRGTLWGLSRRWNAPENAPETGHGLR